jgi:FkbM family methyltransferase
MKFMQKKQKSPRSSEVLKVRNRVCSSIQNGGPEAISKNIIGCSLIHMRPGTIDNQIFHEIWTKKVYDRRLQATDEIIVDVGAHIGLFTLFAAVKCQRARIFCFEPDPDNFQILMKNILLNNLGTRVKAFMVGLSGKKGRRVMHISDSENTGNRSIIDSYKKEHTLEIKTISLSEVCKVCGIDHIDFLKMDIENAEAEVLLTPRSNKTLEATRTISIEFHNYENYLKIKNALRTKGFHFENVSGVESEGGGTCNFYKVADK